MTVKSSTIPPRTVPALWLISLAALMILTRVNFLQHPLSWDEAWNLCAISEFFAGGNRLFTFQLWRHPPLYIELGALLSPLSAGFQARMAGLSLLLNVAALLAFVSLTARFYGRQIALATGIVYTLLPATLLFDTWIKRDPAATLFVVLALWSHQRRREWLAGLMLGIALLSKETAIFYAPAFIPLALVFQYRRKRIQKLTLLYILAIAASCWWYLFFSVSRGSFKDFFTGKSLEASYFAEPWWFYGRQLLKETGWAAFPLLIIGLFTILSGKNLSLKRRLFRARALPLYILIPTHLILALSQGKPRWIGIVLYPLLALIVAVGWQGIFKRISQVTRLGSSRQKTFTSIILLALLLSLPHVGGWRYMDYYRALAPGQANLTVAAYSIADLVNNKVKDQETMLILPMLYRKAKTKPNPIVYWNLTPRARIIHYFPRGTSIDYQHLKNALISTRTHWLLFSPVEETDQAALFDSIKREIDPLGYYLENAVLLRVDRYWRTPEDEPDPLTTHPAGADQ